MTHRTGILLQPNITERLKLHIAPDDPICDLDVEVVPHPEVIGAWLVRVRVSRVEHHARVVVEHERKG